MPERKKPSSKTTRYTPPEQDWTGPGGRERARQATAQLLDTLDLGSAGTLRVARLLTHEEFHARRLGVMLSKIYGGSIYLAATDCRPDLASWRHKMVPDDYWRGIEGIERARSATLSMLSEMGLVRSTGQLVLPAGASAAHTTSRATASVFAWCNLDRMLEIVYAGSATAALRAVLAGIPEWRHDRSPKGYWQGIDGIERAQSATRTLIGEYGWAGLSAEEVAARLTRKKFLQHGLSGMLDAVYDRRGYDALADIYPGLQPWQVSTVPHGYWTGPERRAHGRAATRWLIRRTGLRGAPLQEIARTLDADTFERNGLGGMLSRVYRNSTYEALQDLFPEIRPWTTGLPAPHRFWAGEQGREHAHEAMRWMLAELKLQKSSPTEIAAQLDQAVFVRMGLGGMLGIVYNNSPYAALSDLFPSVRPWQMRGGAPMSYWQGEEGRRHAQEATRWMLKQDNLEKEDPRELAGIIDQEMFSRCGLYGMLSVIYKSSCYAALADLFPELPTWEPRNYAPPGHWQGIEGQERARHATRQMLATMGLEGADPAEVAAAVDKRTFIQHGLGGMLRSVYGTSAYAALADLFPELRPWQMSGHAPQGCWQGEEGVRNGREATQHMLMRLGIQEKDPAEIGRAVDVSVFEREGLGVMLREVYSGSPYEALKAVLPGLLPWQMSKTPSDYWRGASAPEHARQAVLWMLEKLGIDPKPGNSMLRTITKATFSRFNLAGMLAAVYGNSPYKALSAAIPDLLPWQVHTAPRSYWQGAAGRERAREATLSLLAGEGFAVGTDTGEIGNETGYAEDAGDAGDAGKSDGNTVSEIAGKISRASFIEAGLGGMLAGVYSGSVHAALADVIPGLLPWTSGKGTQVPVNYWKGPEGRERAREALRWMVSSLGLDGASPAEVAAAATQDVFISMGLQGMLATVYKSSRFAALSDLYPALQPWQMGVRVPQGYWLGPQAAERARSALNWLLVQEGLQALEPMQVAQHWNTALFTRYGLAGMLKEVYNGSLYFAFADIFPGIYPWQVPLPTPQSYWQGEQGRERARQATRWVLSSVERERREEAGVYAKPGTGDTHVSADDYSAGVTRADFMRLGLRGMLSGAYNDSATRAIADLRSSAPYLAHAAKIASIYSEE